MDVVNNNPENEEKSNDEESVNIKTNDNKLVINENDKIKKYIDGNDLYSKKRKIVFVILVLLLDIVILFGIIASINKLNDRVYKNILCNGKNLSGMDSQEVLEAVNEIVPDEVGVSIRQNGNEIYKFTSKDLEFKVDIDATVKKIFDYGRDSNLFVNNYRILSAMVFGHDLKPVYKYSLDKMDLLIKNIDLSLENRKEDDSFSVDEINHKLIIKRGKTGNTLDYSIEKEKILNAIIFGKDVTIEVDAVTKEPQKLDAINIVNSTNRDAKDAYIDETAIPYKFVNEVVGYNINYDELEEFLLENKEEGQSYEFPIETIEPKIKLADITYKLYKDKLAGYTTYFDPAQHARAQNLNTALQYLNGKIVMPGEVFSYNATVGDITASKGYLPAATFKAGTVVNEVGGGICQTSSTLYNVALMANLEIVERYQHGLPVGYVPPSRDATVYFPVLDFKFKNTRKYPVKIVTSFSYGGTVNISIYGTKEDTEYNIVLSNKYIKTINYPTKYIYDDTMPEGSQQIITNGVNGYMSEAYLTKYLNGSYVTSYKLSTDTYNPQQAVVKIGTLKQE